MNLINRETIKTEIRSWR